MLSIKVFADDVQLSAGWFVSGPKFCRDLDVPARIIPHLFKRTSRMERSDDHLAIRELVASQVGYHHPGATPRHSEPSPCLRPINESRRRDEIHSFRETTLALRCDYEHPPGKDCDIASSATSRQPDCGLRIVAHHGCVEITEAINLCPL